MLGRFSTLFELRTIQYVGVMESGVKPVVSPTDRQIASPVKISDIRYILNPKVYLKYSARKNCRYYIYFKVFKNLVSSQWICNSPSSVISAGYVRFLDLENFGDYILVSKVWGNL